MNFISRQIWLSIHLLIIACFASDDSKVHPLPPARFLSKSDGREARHLSGSNSIPFPTNLYVSGRDGYYYSASSFQLRDNFPLSRRSEILGPHGLWYPAASFEGRRIMMNTSQVHEGFEAEVLGSEGRWFKVSLTQRYLGRSSDGTLAQHRPRVPAGGPYVFYHTKKGDWRAPILSDNHHLSAAKKVQFSDPVSCVNPNVAIFGTSGYWYTFLPFDGQELATFGSDAEVFGADGNWYGVSTTKGQSERIARPQTSPNVTVLDLDGKVLASMRSPSKIEFTYITTQGKLFRKPGVAEGLNSKTYLKGTDGQWRDNTPSVTLPAGSTFGSGV